MISLFGDRHGSLFETASYAESACMKACGLLQKQSVVNRCNTWFPSIGSCLMPRRNSRSSLVWRTVSIAITIYHKINCSIIFTAIRYLNGGTLPGEIENFKEQNSVPLSGKNEVEQRRMSFITTYTNTLRDFISPQETPGHHNPRLTRFQVLKIACSSRINWEIDNPTHNTIADTVGQVPDNGVHSFGRIWEVQYYSVDFQNFST